MKAVLVVDMPNNCGECKLMPLQGIGESICNAVDWEKRPSWCPLKPMPQRYDEGIMREQKGWNRCLDEIMGEKE